jgi:hypothetical protein
MSPNCAACGGTGWLHSMRSWFRGDGTYRHKCWYCDGTGKSSYRPDAGYIAFQARNRAALRSAEVSKP